jgi:hypothetical protein
MTMLVSLQQASDHLRRDTNADDNDLTLKVKGASAAVMRFIGEHNLFTDSAGDFIEDSSGVAVDVPEDIQVATLLLIGDIYSGRAAGDFANGDWFLPGYVMAFLYPYRDPTLA